MEAPSPVLGSLSAWQLAGSVALALSGSSSTTLAAPSAKVASNSVGPLELGVAEPSRR